MLPNMVLPKQQFPTRGAMHYALFNIIGLSINRDSYLYDNDTGTVLQYKGKYIKATTADIPIYAGKNDIVFDPPCSYHMMVVLLGYYINKRDNSEDEHPLGFISQGIIDTADKSQHQLFVDTSTRGRIISDWFNNGYLTYIDMIFKLDEQDFVDLHNFDIPYGKS